MSRLQSSTVNPVVFFFTNNFDHVTGATGVVPYVNLSKNGGSFSAASGTVSEIGRGWYSFSGNLVDRNTLGTLIINATGLNVDPVDLKLEITAYDPFTVPYYADIDLARDTSNTTDEYTVSWFKGKDVLTAGVTQAYINVVKRADGTDLIASTGLSAIGSTGAFKYDATGASRVTVGEAVLVTVSGVIDGDVRVWRRNISRDS